MKPFSVLFCGTSPFAVPSLEALASDPAFEVLAVVTPPDRPVGRKQLLTPPAVKTTALRLSLPLIQTDDINQELQATSYKADFLIAVSFGQLLKQAVLDLPTIAPINVHASLLPRWRGASPIQQAILAGDHETGVTVQRMVKQLDAGPILGQTRTNIGLRETAPLLHDRLAAMGAELLVQTLKKPLKEREQNEAEITFCRKLTREDGMVDPNTHTAEEIDRHVRALTPWPGVTMTMDGETLKIISTSLTDTPDSHPVSCRGNSTVHLLKVQAPGGKPVTGAEWARGKQR